MTATTAPARSPVVLDDTIRPYPPRILAGLVRRADRVALAVRLDHHTRDGHAVAVVDVPKRAILRMIAAEYRRARHANRRPRRIDAGAILDTLIIG
jgi:hypothetical protein